MQISVIIPTYKRQIALVQAMCSLQDQRLPNIDAIVVDNAAESEIERTVAHFNRKANIPIRYVAEPELGLHNARHTGAKAAKGDVLVFTDDDATFDAFWLEAYAKSFLQHPDMVAAGGPVKPIWEVTPPQWLLNSIKGTRSFGILSLMELYEEFHLDEKGSFFGVNMAIRKKTLFDVGGFNPESYGEIWLGDGESGLIKKLRNKQYLIGYVPKAAVYHHIPASRMTEEYFYKRMRNQGACTEYSRFRDHIPGPFSLALRAVDISTSIVRSGLITLLRKISKSDRSLLLRAHMGLSYNASRLNYVLRLFWDKQFRELVTKKVWLADSK